MIKERLIGAYLGLAAGDRIGGPIRMSLCLAESLLEKKIFETDDILRRYLSWWRTEGFDTGLIAHRVFTHIEQGIEAEKAVELVHHEQKGMTGGCNPVHRVLSLALVPFLDVESLVIAAKNEARLTHFDPIVGEVSVGYCLLVRQLILGLDLSEAILASQNYISEAVFLRLTTQVSPFLSRGGYAPDVLESSLYFVREYPDFLTALSYSLGFAGGDNFCPVLVGAITGALYGEKAIPQQALKHCKIEARVKNTAEQLAEFWE